MFFFKSKKNQDERPADADTKKSDNAAISEDISLFDIDKLFSLSGGYKVYAHDQGRKPLEKALKNNIK